MVADTVAGCLVVGRTQHGCRCKKKHPLMDNYDIGSYYCSMIHDALLVVLVVFSGCFG